MEEKQSVGDRIRLARQKCKLNQENMAQALDLSVAAYSNIERDVTDITLSRIQEIARLLKVSPQYLSYGTVEEPIPSSEPQSEYLRPINLEKRIKDLESVVENLKQEIHALKNGISVSRGSSKNKSGKR